MIDRRKIFLSFFLRVLLGVIFFMQGFGKVFTWGVENVYNMDFFLGTYENLLPDFLILGVVYYTSYVELIAGGLLILGLWKNWSLYALGSVLLIVSIGHGMAQPIWDLDHVMYRSILLAALLMIPNEWDQWTLSRFL